MPADRKHEWNAPERPSREDTGPLPGACEPDLESDGLPWDDPDRVAAIPIEDAIDLHTFRPGETASVVGAYLEEAHARGFREVRIIHGRGKGVQRRIVRSALDRHPLVTGFQDAPPERGGWGATIVWLSSRRSSREGGGP